MPQKYSNSIKIKYPPSEKNLINLLEENISKIVNEVKIIEEIILFVSYASRDPHYGSDVDLLFVLSKRTKNDFDVIY